MRLRILQILEKNQFNTGSVHQMFQAATGLREREHDVIVVSRPGSEISERSKQAGIGFRSIPLRHELDLSSVRALRHLVTTFVPDVIHVHKGLSHTLALAATWTRPVPAFVVNRGVSFPLTIWNRAKYRTRRVDRIVAVCDEIKQVVVRTGRVEPDRVEVIHAGTDVDRFDPARSRGSEFRLEKSIPDESFLIMQVGVREWKGWRDLIDVFATLTTTRPDARLALVACRSVAEREAVASYARDKGVADKVHPVEVRVDMPRVLAAADCVVDASWSGTGITGTIREAMSLARPVIATDCGGNRELVSSASYGWLVPPRDRESMTVALMEVMSSKRCSEEVGLAARKRVVDYFSSDVRIDRLENLYREIIDGKSKT